MSRSRKNSLILGIYLALFVSYLLTPLLVMSAATFNTSRFPTIIPWLGTTLQWFDALVDGPQVWSALKGSAIVGFFVIVISLPIGTLAALFLNVLASRFRGLLYGIILAPLLIPGVIVGISTLVFWNNLGVRVGLHLSILSQCSFVISYVMLLVLARMQRFDHTLVGAALDLDASHMQVMRRIILQSLRPILITASFFAFLLSFQDYNATLFTRGTGNTLTVYVASKVKTGVTPAINALGLCMVILTLIVAVLYELRRRRSEQKTQPEYQ